MDCPTNCSSDCGTDCVLLAKELPFSMSWPWPGIWDCKEPPPPDYSLAPSGGERQLQFTPRLNQPSSSDTFIKSSGNVVVSLHNQDPAPSIPWYGLRGHIDGLVHCRQPERVQRVSIKIAGRSFTSAGVFWSRTFTLWNRTMSEQTCPSLHPFSYRLPSRYSTGDAEHQLPPSYRLPWHPSLPVDFVNIKYSIYVCVTYSRPIYKFSGEEQIIEIPFDYIPRTQAETPIVRTPCFFTSMKSSPELWHQALTTLKPRDETSLRPISCLIFLPNPRLYSLRDMIPFHIQLNGPLASLREFLRPGFDNPSNADSLKSEKLLRKCSVECYSVFSVKMTRRTVVTHPRDILSKETELGEGLIYEIPPDMCPLEPDMENEFHLNCKGEIRAEEGTNVGSFQIMNIIVQDLIVLKIHPPSLPNQPAPFLPSEITVPITLVTDPYVEAPDYGGTGL